MKRLSLTQIAVSLALAVEISDPERDLYQRFIYPLMPAWGLLAFVWTWTNRLARAWVEVEAVLDRSAGAVDRWLSRISVWPAPVIYFSG